MDSITPEAATIRALRLDIAYQIARRAEALGISQSARAKHLGIPQPTLSKIANGRVSDLSIEFLIRISVRAGLPLTLQTGSVPGEAGAHLPMGSANIAQSHSSASSEAARTQLSRSERQFTPEQRLQAFIEHNQLIAELYVAGREATALRDRRSREHARP